MLLCYLVVIIEMFRQSRLQAKEPKFAVMISRANMASMTPTKRRDTESYYEVNQSRRPELSRNNSRDHQDRLSTSPLKGPLKKAIQKTIRNISNKENQMGRSRKTSQSRVSRRPLQRDNIESLFEQMHTETQNFVLKYFDSESVHQIPMEVFVDKIIEEYQNLWNTEQAQQILEPFIDKLAWSLGGNQVEWVDLRLLQLTTQEAGVIGLILKIFKELKQEDERGFSNSNLGALKHSFSQQLQDNQDVQNIKNIVQQFMQSMYKCMENEVYNKFNVEMRRMVLRYKESEKLLKIVKDKITDHIDVFAVDQKYMDKVRSLEKEVQEGKQREQRSEAALGKEREEMAYYRGQSQRQAAEIRRLRDEVERLQNAGVYRESLQQKASCVDPHLSRYSTHSQMAPPTVMQFQKSVTKNTYSDFYQAPIITTSILNTSSILSPNSQINTYRSPTLVSTSPAEVKVQVVQHKEYITTSPTVERVYRTETVPTTPSKITVTRIEASPIRSRVIQIL